VLLSGQLLGLVSEALLEVVLVGGPVSTHFDGEVVELLAAVLDEGRDDLEGFRCLTVGHVWSQTLQLNEKFIEKSFVMLSLIGID
jgi:hypothetical protein